MRHVLLFLPRRSCSLLQSRPCLVSKFSAKNRLFQAVKTSGIYAKNESFWPAYTPVLPGKIKFSFCFLAGNSVYYGLRVDQQTMSDILNTLCLEKLTRRLDIDTDHCLNYIRRQCISSTEIVLTVHVPHDCLRQWYDAKQGVLRETECTYVQILNACIRTCPNGVKIQDGERIEGRLRRSCLRAKQKFRGKSGAE